MIHRAIRATLIALVAVAAVSPATAEPAHRGLDDYTVTTWNESDGLLAGAQAFGITAIEQDADGYLWIGTDAGLVRFDGVRFQSLDALWKLGQPYESVTALLSARDRSLWIGLRRSGLVRMHEGGFTLYGERDGLRGYANSLLQDRQGAVWVATTLGLFRFDGHRWVTVGESDGLMKDGPVLTMHEDRAGRFWVATRDTVLRRDRSGEPFKRIEAITLSSNIWQSLTEDASGRMWITDFRAGLRRVGDPGGPAPAPQSGWGVRLLHDRRENIWVATRGKGLWRVRPGSSGRPRIDVIRSTDGLANDAVQSVFEDREGNIWVGTNAGLQRLTPHRVTPLTDLPIARATATPRDGSVWVGSTEGLFKIWPGTRQQYQEEHGLPGIVVLALTSGPRGTLWVATERALAKVEDGHFSTILEMDGSRRIFSIAVSDGAVWVRDVNYRLTRLTEHGDALPIDVPQAFQASAFTLATDREGRLWIGTSSGKVGVRSPGGAFQELDSGVGSIAAIFQDASGAIWFGGDLGLSRFADDRFATIGTMNGLRSGVSSIIEDGSGALWLGLRSGIARFEKDEIGKALASPQHQVQYRLFNSSEGAAGIPVSAGSRTAVRSADGRLWFATSGGVTVVDPENIGDPRPPVPVRIEAVVADTARFAPSAGLRLPARTSHLQFAFTALTLIDSMRVQFRYRLEGQDRDWVDAGTTRQTSYTNLAPGQYRFLLSGSNGDAWSEPSVLEFSIQPTFYQTRWFYGVCLLAIGSMVYGAWRLNARRVRGQFALVLAERIRMSRAIHDTLLQGLAGLALQLDDLSHGFDTPSTTLKERVLSMRRRVEDYIRDARQSIWDLRSPALESKPFPDALRDAGLRAINGKPIAFEFATAGTPRPCSPAVQEQLLRICQEAVTNAVRHGRPERVGVELEYSPGAVRVRVEDDGLGFDPSASGCTEGHYGVISMKERAAQVRGHLTIASSPGQGTRVETVVPPM